MLEILSDVQPAMLLFLQMAMAKLLSTLSSNKRHISSVCLFLRSVPDPLYTNHKKFSE